MKNAETIERVYTNEHTCLQFKKEKDITDALLQLIKDINKRHFKKYNKMHYFHMKCGIYYSHPQIPPFEFYECSKKQYENIIQKDSLISYNFYPPSQQ